MLLQHAWLRWLSFCMSHFLFLKPNKSVYLCVNRQEKRQSMPLQTDPSNGHAYHSDKMIVGLFSFPKKMSFFGLLSWLLSWLLQSLSDAQFRQFLTPNWLFACLRLPKCLLKEFLALDCPLIRLTPDLLDPRVPQLSQSSLTCIPCLPFLTQ